MTMTSPQTFPYRRPEPPTDVGDVLPMGAVFTLVGQVERIDVGWGGQLRCRLKLSVGTLTLFSNRESGLLDANAGDWLRVRVRLSFGTDEQPSQVRLLGVRPATPDPDLAWVPTSLCDRHAHMRRLRAVLAELGPVPQLVFMLALSTGGLQHAFFQRVAALDHHIYPGGLFDQSVRAAELALADAYDNDTERGIAALTALLFDLGKGSAATVSADKRRLSLMAPHPNTGRCVARALGALEPLDPQAVGELRALLTATPATALSASTGRLAARVHAAVGQAWFEEQCDA